MCLSLSQARSSPRDWDHGHVPGCLARLPGGAGSRGAPPPRPGGRSPFSLCRSRGAWAVSKPGPAPLESSLLIGRVCGDVAGIAEQRPGAGRAGGIVRRPGLC